MRGSLAHAPEAGGLGDLAQAVGSITRVEPGTGRGNPGFPAFSAYARRGTAVALAVGVHRLDLSRAVALGCEHTVLFVGMIAGPVLTDGDLAR